MTRQDLLIKSTWTAKDIMVYFDVGHTKAYEIFNKAKNKFNGTVPSISNAVKRDSVLASQGLDVERELYIKGLMKNEKELHKTNI